MSNTWSKNYEELVDYISKHPSIEISKKSIVILDDVRPGFYQLFDAVRLNFIREKFAGELEKQLSSARTGARRAGSLSTVSTLIPLTYEPPPTGFFSTLLTAWMRGLFDLLFKLLKHEFDLATFEQKPLKL